MGERRYRVNLETLRHMRLFLAERGDIDALQSLAVSACTFAYFSIHNRVETQEKFFTEWTRGEWTPRGLAAHRMPLECERLVCERLTDIRLFCGDDSENMARTLMTFPYLGTAKSTFACALMGYPDAPCIDMHMAKLCNLASIPTNLSVYRAIVKTTVIPDTLSQWDRYYGAVRAYAVSQHDCYFSHVLGDRAVLRNVPYTLPLFA